MEFFLAPDFSKITPQVCINALGQALFSLSLGMGILVTYASYYKDSTKLGSTAGIVSSLTLLVALLMGLIIFPAVAAFGLTEHGLSGTTLVFVTLPEVFASMQGTYFWSALFFLLLIVAALTSTVSIAEVCVRFIQERTGASRVKAVLWVLCPMIVLAGVCALSFGVLGDVKICGYNLFDALDAFTNNLLLPVVAFFTCIYVGWFAPRGFFVGQVSNHGRFKTGFARVALFVVRWFAPVAILTIFISNII